MTMSGLQNAADNHTTGAVTELQGSLDKAEKGESTKIASKVAEEESADPLSFDPHQTGKWESGQKAVVLSFRALQLKRIEVLQDKLLVLQTIQDESLPAEMVIEKNELMDELLQKYGTF
jgi:hypothetical protein